MFDCKKNNRKEQKNLFFILVTFIALENFIAIVSKKQVLLLLIPVVSVMQCVFFICCKLSRKTRFNYYRQFGVMGMINSIVFSFIASFLISDILIHSLIAFLSFSVVLFFEILTFELLTKKVNKQKQRVGNNFCYNKLVSVIIVTVLFMIKFLEIDIMLILKILSTLLAVLLTFCYWGIIASRTNQEKD